MISLYVKFLLLVDNDHKFENLQFQRDHVIYATNFKLDAMGVGFALFLWVVVVACQSTRIEVLNIHWLLTESSVMGLVDMTRATSFLWMVKRRIPQKPRVKKVA